MPYVKKKPEEKKIESKKDFDDSFIEEKGEPKNPNIASEEEQEEYLKSFLPSLEDSEVVDFVEETSETLDEDPIQGWESQFKEESYENVLKQGEIFPNLYPRLNAMYNVKLLSTPKEIKTKFGVGYVVELEYNGLHMSLYCSNSFLFNLGVQKRLKKLTNQGLIGREIVFQKSEQMVKGQKANVTVVQIK